MSYKLLYEVFPHGEDVVETGAPEQWPGVEVAIGTVLPSDYKGYINTFGTGIIGDFIRPFNPFSKIESLNLIWASKEIVSYYREFKEEFGEENCPYPLYPEQHGLLPWGDTINGDVFFWQTQDSPDEWRIVISQARSTIFEEFEGPMTGFLLGLIFGNIRSNIVSELINKDALFAPLEKK